MTICFCSSSDFFYLDFPPWTNISIYRLFWLSKWGNSYLGSFYLRIWPFLIPLLYFPASFPTPFCTQKPRYGLVSVLRSPGSIFLSSLGKELIDVSCLWSYLPFFLVYIYHPICLFLPPLFSVLQFRFIIFSFQLPFTALNFILPLLLCSSRFFFIYDIPIFYVDIVSFVFIGKFHFILTWFCSILLWKYWLFY